MLFLCLKFIVMNYFSKSKILEFKEGNLNWKMIKGPLQLQQNKKQKKRTPSPLCI